MNKSTYVVVGALLLVLVGIGTWLWRHEVSQSQSPPPTPPAVAVAPAPAASVASAPSIKHPIETALATDSAAAPLDIESALTKLFGRKAVLALFQLDGFARRVVATVDNLGREHAPARLWPLNPAQGRFMVEKQGGAEVISADNGLRYTPYLLLIETVDLRQLVDIYTRFYPVFQQAYEELGYPKQYFNDRLVDVIDQLLATADVTKPVKVRLPTINGPVQPQRPWVLYEFDDPALQSLSAGQKILLRIGPVNERRVKTKLAEIRRLVTARAALR